MTNREVINLYDNHPINEAQVLSTLAQRGKALDALRPEDLFDLDQDHYGGVAAVDALAQRAGVGVDSLVLDVCSGLGGPARYVASRYRCKVVGVDLTASRCLGARRLAAMVGLADEVCFVNGNGTALPFGTAIFGACMSQEAFLHVPDKAALLLECARVLAPGGRIAFSDWVATPALKEVERDGLRNWIAAYNVETVNGYRVLLERAGFVGVTIEDLSPEWRAILRQRLEMYRGLRAETVARFGEARYQEFDRLYDFLVTLVETGKIGGARFNGRRPL